MVYWSNEIFFIFITPWSNYNAFHLLRYLGPNMMIWVLNGQQTLFFICHASAVQTLFSLWDLGPNLMLFKYGTFGSL